MPIMRYKLIGTNMMERPTKGEWVRWDDVKDRLPPDYKSWPRTNMTEEMVADSVLPEGKKNATDSDNKRSRK